MYKGRKLDKGQKIIDFGEPSNSKYDTYHDRTAQSKYLKLRLAPV